MRTFWWHLILVLLASPIHAQERLPVIDMHLHALAANHQGPPPVAMCTPINPFPAWDPAQPYGATFTAMLKKPPCADPVWSPLTDAALMAETIEVVKRHNILPRRSAERWLLLRADRPMLHAALMVGPLGNSKHR